MYKSSSSLRCIFVFDCRKMRKKSSDLHVRCARRIRAKAKKISSLSGESFFDRRQSCRNSRKSLNSFRSSPFSLNLTDYSLLDAENLYDFVPKEWGGYRANDTKNPIENKFR